MFALEELVDFTLRGGAAGDSGLVVFFCGEDCAAGFFDGVLCAGGEEGRGRRV